MLTLGMLLQKVPLFLVLISCDALPVLVHAPEVHHSLRISEIRRSPVALHSLRNARLHARSPVLVHEAEIEVRGRIALLRPLS